MSDDVDAALAAFEALDRATATSSPPCPEISARIRGTTSMGSATGGLTCGETRRSTGDD